MILELDCGNSLLKWRLCDSMTGQVTPIQRNECLDSILGELASTQGVQRCRLVSVRTNDETSQLVSGIYTALHVPVDVAKTTQELAGVRNGYLEPNKLGVDRWLALVAAFNDAKAACMAIDLGTAVTVDLVSCDGLHLGGFITPGLGLMEAELLRHTRHVRFGPSFGGGDAEFSPGRSTAKAVTSGCRSMVRAYLADQIARAHAWLGAEPVVYITGGDRSLVEDLPGAIVVPDLVFRGLAYACP